MCLFAPAARYGPHVPSRLVSYRNKRTVVRSSTGSRIAERRTTVRTLSHGTVRRQYDIYRTTVSSLTAPRTSTTREEEEEEEDGEY